MNPTHILFAGGMALIWGFGFVASKYGASHMPPLFFLTLRFCAAGLILVWFVKVPRQHLVGIGLFAASMGLGHFGLFYVALSLGVDASTAAIIWQLQVPMTTLLAAIVLRERPGWRGALGIAIAFAGVVILAGEPRHLDKILGIGLMLASSVMWAIANIQAKRLAAVGPLTLNAWMSVMAAPVMLALSLALEQGQIDSLLTDDWRVHGSLLYIMAGSTLLGYWLWYFLLQNYPVSRVAGFMLLVPFVGVLAGVLVMHDPLTWQTGVGGLATLVGVALIVLRRAHAEDAVAGGPRS
jgi:O-acetylserine/cysteine efflux transporter